MTSAAVYPLPSTTPSVAPPMTSPTPTSPGTPTGPSVIDLYRASEETAALISAQNLVTPDRLPMLLDHYLTRTPTKPDVSVAIWGPPGVGKTSGIAVYAKANKYRLIVLHLQLFDPSDLKGIAIRQEDGSVRWVTSSYMPQQTEQVIDLQSGNNTIDLGWKYAEQIEIEFPDNPELNGKVVVQSIKKGRLILTSECTANRVTIRIQERAILFLDEISTANTDVQNAALSLVQDRRINEFFLPTSCRIVAAGNTEEDGSFVHSISSALGNRFLHLVMKPTIDSFLTYLMGTDVNPNNRALAFSFLSMYGDPYLHRYNSAGMTSGRYGFMTPRTWESWCRQYDSEQPTWMRNLTTIGLFGTEGSHTLIAFLNLTIKLPSSTDIIQGKPYTWSSSTDRGTTLMMLGILVSRFREVFDAHKSNIRGALTAEAVQKSDREAYPEPFRIASNAIYKFINNHLNADAKTTAHYMITAIANIPPRCLYGDEFTKFCSENQKIWTMFRDYRNNGA